MNAKIREEIKLTLSLINVKRSGEQEEVDFNKKSFNARRSVIARDDDTKKLWLVHGSSVSEEVMEKATEAIKIINAELGFSYSIIEVSDEERKEVIDVLVDFFENPSKRKKSVKKKKTTSKKQKKSIDLSAIPAVKVDGPKKKVKSFVKSSDEDGPQLEDFQIAYYEEHPTELIIRELHKIYDDQDLESIANHIQVIRELIQKQASKKEAKKVLTESMNTLLDRIF